MIDKEKVKEEIARFSIVLILYFFLSLYYLIKGDKGALRLAIAVPVGLMFPLGVTSLISCVIFIRVPIEEVYKTPAIYSLVLVIVFHFYE